MKIGWVFSPFSGNKSREFTSTVTEQLAQKHQVELWIPEGQSNYGDDVRRIGARLLDPCAEHLSTYDIAVFNLEPKIPNTLDLVNELAQRVSGVVILHGFNDSIPEKAVQNSIGIILDSQKVLAIAEESKRRFALLRLETDLASASSQVIAGLDHFLEQLLKDRLVRNMFDRVAHEIQAMDIFESSSFYQRLSDKIQEIVG